MVSRKNANTSGNCVVYESYRLFKVPCEPVGQPEVLKRNEYCQKDESYRHPVLDTHVQPAIHLTSQVQIYKADGVEGVVVHEFLEE